MVSARAGCRSQSASAPLPIELFEVLHRFTLQRVGALVLNIAVAAYLVYRLRRVPKRGNHEVLALAS
jgi:uncharacterized membrane protein (DUF2068 family)